MDAIRLFSYFIYLYTDADIIATQVFIYNDKRFKIYLN